MWERGRSRHICDNEREHHRREKLLTWDDEVPLLLLLRQEEVGRHIPRTPAVCPHLSVGGIRFRLIAPFVK